MKYAILVVMSNGEWETIVETIPNNISKTIKGIEEYLSNTKNNIEEVIDFKKIIGHPIYF